MNIFYFSPIPWYENWQRPQTICSLLAQSGAEVTYFSVAPLGKGKMQKTEENKNLRHWNQLLIPLALCCPFFEYLNRKYVKNLLKKQTPDIVVLTNPRQLDFIPERWQKELPVIYDCMDFIPEFYSGRMYRYMAAKEKELCGLAKGIIVSSAFLHRYISGQADPEKILLVRNAAKQSFREEYFKAAPATLPANNLLYVGTMDFWIDWDILTGYAKRNPEKHICMVGPLKTAPPELPDNIHIYPPVSHKEVLSYLKAAAILLIPFKTVKLIEGVDPVKMYEYLATGKPVISSYWQELDYFRNCTGVHFYSGTEEFEHLANSLKTSGNTASSDTFLTENSWESRCAAYLDFLQQTTY